MKKVVIFLLYYAQNRENDWPLGVWEGLEKNSSSLPTELAFQSCTNRLRFSTFVLRSHEPKRRRRKTKQKTRFHMSNNLEQNFWTNTCTHKAKIQESFFKKKIKIILRQIRKYLDSDRFCKTPSPYTTQWISNEAIKT